MSRNGRKSRNPDVSRRTVLDWLGGATVLSLSGLLTHCSSSATGEDLPAGTGGGGAGAGGSGGLGTGGSNAAGQGGVMNGGAGGGPACPDPGAFNFAPGERLGELFERWPVRTVDSQDLMSILQTWRLTIDGMVEEPRVLSFFDLLCLGRQDQVTDFHCVEGWSVLDIPWNGVGLVTLFEMVRPLSTATHVTFHTIGDKYNESLPLGVAQEAKTMLAFGAQGSTLPLEHGFPARVVIPRLLGYKNAKYVERIELTDAPVDGFWVNAGYGYDGEVNPSRLRDGKY